MPSYSDLAARIRVPFHFLLAAVVLVFARPTPVLLGIGAALVVLGLWVRAWAAGHLEKNGSLTTSGPYAHLRHPLYFGSLFILAGFAVAAARVWLSAVVALYFLMIFFPVMRREELQRRAIASDVYTSYIAKVPAFLPRLRPVSLEGREGNAPVRFDGRLYRKNREWRAAVGCGLLLLILLGRLLWS